MNRFLLALGCLALVACNNAPSPIVLTDSGVGTDTPVAPTDTGGGGTDTGGGGTDAGGGGVCGSIAGTMPVPVPASCMPRCSLATRNAYAMCMGNPTCAQTALTSDMMPPAMLDVGGTPQSLNCVGCFVTQQYSCTYENGCADETVALLVCGAGGGACTAEQATLQTCVGTNMAAIQTCLNTRAIACFSST